MAATKTRSTPSTNGRGPSGALARAQEAGGSVATAARRAKGPVVTVGAAAAGLAGGLALGSRVNPSRRGLGALLTPQPNRILGLTLGRKNGVVRTAEALGQVARELSSARKQVSATTDDVHQIRELLDKANRRSPIEVLLDGLTHRRGAHKRES